MRDAWTRLPGRAKIYAGIIRLKQADEERRPGDPSIIGSVLGCLRKIGQPENYAGNLGAVFEQVGAVNREPAPGIQYVDAHR